MKMKMKETVQMNVVRYRDKNGIPVCAFNMLENEFCIFHRVKKFGTVNVCAFDTMTPLERYGNNDSGFLVPSCDCPLWKEKN